MHEINRMPTAIPVRFMQTYALSAPARTHRRRATCQEANCPRYLNGWRTVVPNHGPQAVYIRSDRTRRHFEQPAMEEGHPLIGMTEFVFEAGQRCFKHTEHTVPLGREPIYLRRPGDWRGSAYGSRQTFKSGRDWVDDFGEHQANIATAIERG